MVPCSSSCSSITTILNYHLSFYIVLPYIPERVSKLLHIPFELTLEFVPTVPSVIIVCFQTGAHFLVLSFKLIDPLFISLSHIFPLILKLCPIGFNASF